MGKVENSQVKDYIVAFATEKLNNCKLFVKVYGKKFVEKSLTANLDKVYTNEVRGDVLGYYSPSERNITLCTRTENGSIITPCL